MLKTIHPPQPWKAFPQPCVFLQRPGTPYRPVIFEVFEVSVGETGVFETKVPSRHLSAKSPSPPLETKGCFQSVMVFSLSVTEAPSWASAATRTGAQGDSRAVAYDLSGYGLVTGFWIFMPPHSHMFPYQPERWSVMTPKASTVYSVFRCPSSAARA